MTTESKKRSLELFSPSTNTDQLSPLFSNGHDETQSLEKQKPIDTFLQTNSDNIDSNLKGDMKQLKRYANDILHDDRSTVELRPDGSIVITLHPHPQLSNELISSILRYFDYLSPSDLFQYTLVNKQFYSVANPLLWKTLTFANSQHLFITISDLSLLRLGTLLQHVRQLLLNDSHCTDVQLLRMLPHLLDLENFSINNKANITGKSLQVLPSYCQHLISLTLLHIAFTSTSFSTIGQHCRQLNYLHWKLTEDQSPEWLALFAQCPLKSLKLFSISPWNSNSLFMMKSWQHLTRLYITFENPPAHMKSLLRMASTTNNDHLPFTENDITTTTTTDVWWPHLTHLSLEPCDDVDDTTLIEFIKSHPHLHDLKLHRNNQLTDTTVDTITQWLPNLTCIYFDAQVHIYPNAIIQLIKKCKYLETVVINSYRDVDLNDVVDVIPGQWNWFNGYLCEKKINKIRQRGPDWKRRNRRDTSDSEFDGSDDY